MSSSYTYQTSQEVIKLPDVGQAQIQYSKTSAFLEAFAERTHPVRRWQVMRNRRAEFYDASIQWLTKTANGGTSPESLHWVHALWGELNKQWWERAASDIPLPVFNEGYAPRANETARLLKPLYAPKVVARGENPNWRRKLVAIKAEHSLQYDLEEMHWDRQGDILSYLMPLHGGAFVHSWWDQTWDQVNKINIQPGVACSDPGCDFKLASPDLTSQEYQGARQKFPDTLPPAFGDATLHTCPQCPDHPPLQPWDPTQADAMKGDSLGRPIGESNPMGRWRLAVESPYDVFVQNYGVDVDPTDIREYLILKIWPMDKILLYHPDADIEPDKIDTLVRNHPILGSPELNRANTFRDSVWVYQYYRMPRIISGTKEMDNGRYIVKAGSGKNSVLADLEMMLPSMTKKQSPAVPRARLEFIPWEFLAGARLGCSGFGIWDLVFSAQDSRNEIASMRTCVRQHMAMPTIIVREGMNVQAVENLPGVAGQTLQIDTDALNPQLKPEILEGTVLNPTTEAESNDAKDYINRATGYTDAESGGQVPNVSAATAYNVMLGESTEKRKPRLKRIKKCLARQWNHGLRLKQNLYAEPRSFYFEDVDGENVEETLSGDDIDDLMTVVVRDQPEFTSADEKREVIFDGIKNQIINPLESPEMRRKLAKAIDFPTEFYENENIQESNAEREWFAFYKKKQVPIVDETLDDGKIHLDCHARATNTELYRSWKDEGNWNGAWAIIAPIFDVDMKMLAQKAQMLVSAVMMYPMIVQSNAQAGLPPPPPPPSQIKTIQVQIFEMWSDKLSQAGFQINESLNYCLAWRAHMEAHTMGAEMKQMISQMGIPQLAPPGGPATAAGTQVTPSSPPADIAASMGNTMGGASASAGMEGGGRGGNQ